MRANAARVNLSLRDISDEDLRTKHTEILNQIVPKSDDEAPSHEKGDDGSGGMKPGSDEYNQV